MITNKKLNNILNKFQMFPLGMWWKYFQNIVGEISNDCQLLWGIKCGVHVDVTFQMLHKCSHRFQVEHMIWEHLECTQSVIGR